MYEALTERQLNDWRMIYVIEPFGEKREDVRCALQRISIHQASGVKKRLRVDDFEPRFKNPFTGPISQDELKRKGKRAAALAGGTFIEAAKE